jgi:O-antigen ligase
MNDPLSVTRAESNGSPHPHLSTGNPSSRVLLFFFGLFLFATAFSIALAQITLTISALAYLWIRWREPSRAELHSLKPLLLAWGVYFLWLLVSSMVNDHTWRSLSCIREEWLLVILPVGIYLTRREAISRRLLAVLASGLLIVSVYGVIQHFTGFLLSAGQHLNTAGENYRLSGNFSHPLTYGYYVVTATIFFLTYLLSGFKSHSKRFKALLITTTSFGLIASALCNSRGPILALLIGLLVLGLLIGRLRWAIIGVALVAIVALVLSPGLMAVFSKKVANDWQTDNPEGRLFIWKQAGAIAADNPVFGCGPGNFGEAYSAHLPPEFADTGTKGHAHNDFIHQAAIGGLPAALLFIIFWAVACRHLWKVSRTPGLNPLQKALALAGLVASATFIAGSMTECAIADEELRQLLYALWAFTWQPAADNSCQTRI